MTDLFLVMILPFVLFFIIFGVRGKVREVVFDQLNKDKMKMI